VRVFHSLLIWVTIGCLSWSANAQDQYHRDDLQDFPSMNSRTEENQLRSADFQKLKHACETADLRKSYVDQSDWEYLYVEIAVGGNRRFLLYFLCRYFSEAHQPAKIRAPKTSPRPLDIPHWRIAQWLKSSAFQRVSFFDFEELTFTLQTFLGWHLGPRVSAETHESFNSFVEKKRYQEAIWVLGEAGLWDEVDRMAPRLEEMMLGSDVVKESFFGNEGVTKDKRMIVLESGISGLHKPGKWSRLDIAAYKIDRLLHFNFVPVTVPRKNSSGVMGSYQYFVKDVQYPSSIHDRTAALNYFDQLIVNRDRHLKNFLFLPWCSGELKLVAIDHDICLGLETSRNLAGPIAHIPSQEIYERLKDLNFETATAALGDTLLPQTIELFMKRRDIVLRHSEDLIREKGEAAFFYIPFNRGLSPPLLQSAVLVKAKGTITFSATLDEQ